jgi:hypothetical protein
MSMIDEIEKYGSVILDPSELAKLESQFARKIPSKVEYEQYEESFKQTSEGIVLLQHIFKVAKAYKDEMIKKLKDAPDEAVFQTLLRNQDCSEDLLNGAEELAKYYSHCFQKYLENRGFFNK